jgi:hypothetical protein
MSKVFRKPQRWLFEKIDFLSKEAAISPDGKTMAYILDDPVVGDFVWVAIRHGSEWRLYLPSVVVSPGVPLAKELTVLVSLCESLTPHAIYEDRETVLSDESESTRAYAEDMWASYSRYIAVHKADKREILLHGRGWMESEVRNQRVSIAKSVEDLLSRPLADTDN